MKTKTTGQMMTPARECPLCKQWVWLPNYPTHKCVPPELPKDAKIKESGNGP